MPRVLPNTVKQLEGDNKRRYVEKFETLGIEDPYLMPKSMFSAIRNWNVNPLPLVLDNWSYTSICAIVGEWRVAVAPPFGDVPHPSPPPSPSRHQNKLQHLVDNVQLLDVTAGSGSLVSRSQWAADLGCMMKPRRPRVAVCPLLLLVLLLTAPGRFGAAARHGCLFEKKLCPREQPCSNDGLFGQCWAPHHDPVQYLVSVPALYKLQEVLKDLMKQGMTWRDDVTQAAIGRELSHIPSISSSQLHQRKRLLSQLKILRPEETVDPQMIQQYINYLTLDPSPPSVRGQVASLDPYNYQQDEAERSLNSLEDNPSSTFLRFSAPRSRSRGKALDRDKQLLQNLVSNYLASPSSSLSSSVQAAPRHRGAPAVSFPLASSFTELEFPLDYDQDYVSHVQHLSNQPEIKVVPKYDALAGLDARSVQRLDQLLDRYGLNIQDLSPDQRDKLPALLKQLHLESSFSPKASKENYGNNVGSGKKITQGFMDHKMDATDGLPIMKSSKPADVQKATSSGLVAKLGKKKPEDVLAPVISHGTNPNPSEKEDKTILEAETSLKIQEKLEGQQVKNDSKALPLATRVRPGSRWVSSTLVAFACIGGILVAALSVTCLRHHAHRLAAKKLGLGVEGGSFSHQEYQHMASKGAFGRLEAAALGAVAGPNGGTAPGGGKGAGAVGGTDSRVSSVSSQFSDGAQPSPGSHSSTPSWCEEPAQANMDISTGHMILAYMEDHLRNKDRLLKEWDALCSYQAEPSSVSVAQSEPNTKKNRFHHSLPYDHARVKLKPEINPSRTDYINASTIIDHDPRMPAYIATQGPLSHTISDFWQMVWETGCTVIVMMTALVEEGEKQCDRYWPDEGSSLYHIYEVNLVSEHIWCNDFLVRSFYLKNVHTQETRTLTQFHFLSWPAHGIPTSTRPLLDFRRKVNKCYRGRSCPIIVHCSNGTGRTGTYILIDMVLNRMAKGVKEIDIAATLEHVRDQRPGMVRTKDQFEFALTAVAEEVNAILKALPQ
ncbi:receptor-type tyrosine-protein phosphatase-like N isoform X2 [Syngnathoides biaculeatus]|uniref:receptor-type tyrosine-protein phosphatase-like N isoform X2 n=1 Tax=Syngnathoides biaculeatus TaxID=300417 RepID=UPI002ADE6FFE|nr:receptor-type tyrosine-protein phosphatase-like N isoform X2 [Syngnathoides biaculeatus]